MNMSFKTLTACLFLLFSGVLTAQQSQDFGDYVVHYNALNTQLLPPQVAKANNILRSGSRALLNITVLKKTGENTSPIHATVTAAATNLTGQRRQIQLREVSEPTRGDNDPGAVYYLGEFRINNEETFSFQVEIIPDGETKTLNLNFRQQFFTER
ncbi:MAG: DUF4426 domain-containing protein [Xanthomonadales bacterium]|nr:DUF4426 domain-containing protein [Xanthomonadales bacterium]